MQFLETDLIIFDLDGTLIDSSEDIAWAANMALADLGHKSLETSKVKEGIGWGVKSLLEKMMPGESDEHIEQARIRFLEYYWQNSTVNTFLYPGVAETLEYFYERNTRMAVVTNKLVDYSEKILRELGIIRYFDQIIGGDSVVNRKPNPEPIEKIIASLGVKHEKSIIVGDSPVDCEAGKRAGISTIGVEYGFRSRQELEEAGCDIIISDIADLQKIIKKIS